MRRVRWPILMEPREPGGCDGLSPAAIEVLEDGEPLPVKSVDREKPETIHAVLFDTSGSMLGSLDHAKKGVARYVRDLPPGERLMVASFDEILTLGSPLTTDKMALERAIERMELGGRTALWDALYDLVRVLEAFPERKLVVLLSDGCDTLSLGEHDFASVLDLATRTPDLTVLAIGLGLSRCDGGLARIGVDASQTKLQLQILTTRTGGSFYDVQSADQVSRAYQEIHERLGRESFVTYEPEPLGSAPKDGSKPHRWRRVKVRARERLPCRVTSAGPERRLEGRLETESAVHLTGSAAGRGSPPATRIRLAVPRDWPESVRGEESYLLLEPERIRGRFPDFVTEQGVLYSDRRYRASGRLQLEPSRLPEFETRDFEVEVPPLPFVKAHLRAPEDVLLHMIDRASASTTASAQPLLIHGRTFLALRASLGQALFSYPGYREWAVGKLVADKRAEFEPLLREYAAAHGLSPNDTERLRATLLEAAASPEPRDPERYLAEWLGDIRASDLARALERRVANELLAPSGEADPERLQRAWPRIGRWFPPPTRVRITTPLVPAYDPERDVIGFYRVLLPRPEEGGAPADLVPEAPFGLLALGWLLGEPTLGSELRGGFEVASVDYDTPARGELRRLRQRARERGWIERGRWVRAVSIRLERRDAPSEALVVKAYFLAGVEPSASRGKREPICMSAEPVPERDGLPEIAEPISRWIASRGWGCEPASF